MSIIDDAENALVLTAGIGVAALVIWFVWTFKGKGALPQILKDVKEQTAAANADLSKSLAPSDPTKIASQVDDYWQTQGRINEYNKAQGITPNPAAGFSVPSWPTFGDYWQHLSNLLPWNWDKPTVPAATPQQADGSSVDSYQIPLVPMELLTDLPENPL
jgi:hypothetical protein